MNDNNYNNNYNNNDNYNNNNNYQNTYNNEYDQFNNPQNNNNINNQYPSFSTFYNNTENNAGYNNRNNFNNNYNNNNYNNNRNNRNNDDLMNDLSEVFEKQRIAEQSNPNEMDNDLPTYSQIHNIQNLDKENSSKIKHKNSNENDGLVNYIGSLNKNMPLSSVADCAPIPIKNSNFRKSTSKNINIKKSYKNNDNEPIKEDFNFGFEESINNNMSKNNSNLQFNINNELDKERSKKKLYVNKSSFNPNQGEEDYDEDNPYRGY